MATDSVALKLPALWTNDTETWFCQAEAQFAIRKITEEQTKFYHVVAVLDSDSASKVKHIIRNPPQKPYTALKQAITQKYEMTVHERAAAILAITSLGDYKPSQLMDKMMNILGPHEGGILLPYHFKSIMPDYVRNTLALSKEEDLQRLAAEADKIFLAGQGQHNQVCSTESAEQPEVTEAEVDRIQRRQPHQRDRTHNRKTNYQLCFYHFKFGDKAKKCTPPCDKAEKSGNSKAGQQ